MVTNIVLLGKRICQARQDRRWSKADLARKAGLSPSYVTRIEQGAYDRPSMESVSAIASALGINVLTLTDPPPAEADDDRAELRRLIAQRVGPNNADLVDHLVTRLEGRGPVNTDAVLRVLDALLDAMPPMQ